MDGKRANPDAVAAGIAERQHGAVSLRQLRAAGLTADAIQNRTRAGRLHRVHRGVFAVGHPGLSNEGRWMAAVLACGEGAVLSHRSAAALWELLPAHLGAVDVTVATPGGRRPRSGIQVHRTTTLARESVTRRKGIPVTKPVRTLADLRRVLTEQELRRAVRQAGILGLEIGDAVAESPTRSELEDRFLRLCRRHRLPLPEVNVRVGHFEVDFLWRDRYLIVEADGYRYHRGRQAFESDRARDLELRQLGYDVIRLTFRQVVDEPDGVSRTLRALLVASDGA